MDDMTASDGRKTLMDRELNLLIDDIEQLVVRSNWYIAAQVSTLTAELEDARGTIKELDEQIAQEKTEHADAINAITEGCNAEIEAMRSRVDNMLHSADAIALTGNDSIARFVHAHMD